MRKIQKVIIHCSATEEGKDYTVEDINSWHLERGFKKIGYHYVIYRDGSIHVGRPLEEAGAHCKTQNVNSIGICYIGGLRNGKAADTRTPEQKEALKKIVAACKLLIPDITIHGHREFAAKDCPCFDVSAEEW